ncbi:Heme oxygenase [Legionella quinlivanii]|uniref:Heme oxygenase n=1 Tax=Legionella quinlivanii TaxID=45073 RepID=A0A0W0Y0L1_9GAMM|nr:biliverdin-producing heme oxygenase [Legionella quinlivanii]KTD50341.1 Heme oxygenase [Legionella quinlivanii]SEF43024.1 Heme oxygenase [Legionella quinlivanii DSM 21216]STY11941.1 Heme oxygenase [Legionella quinlivanii]
MMAADSLVNRLHINPKHELASNTPFMLRMLFKKENDLPEKTDIVNLFIQYIPLYKAMETRLEELTKERAVSYLNIFCKEPWLNRSHLVEEDISEMINYVPDEEQHKLLPIDYTFPATKAMANAVEKADPMHLLTYLTVRNLADCYGGQALGRLNQRAFGEEHPLSARFYKSASRQARNLGEEVNNLNLSREEEHKLMQISDDFFQMHIDLFEEMEARRHNA